MPNAYVQGTMTGLFFGMAIIACVEADYIISAIFGVGAVFLLDWGRRRAFHAAKQI